MLQLGDHTQHFNKLLDIILKVKYLLTGRHGGGPQKRFHPMDKHRIQEEQCRTSPVNNGKAIHPHIAVVQFV